MHRKAGSNNISARFSSTKLMLINGTQLTVDGAVTFSSALAMSLNRLQDLQIPSKLNMRLLRHMLILKQVHWT